MTLRGDVPPHWWALLAGNFAIGCGVMVVAGSLNDIVRSLGISVAVGGQLVSVSAVVMCLGAPLLAISIGAFDRRRLLVLALSWYAIGHALAALMPDFATLLPVRALGVLAAAAFTPQAAAALSAMTAPEDRGRAITFIFLGWSLSSVLGMPLHSYIGETFGWRWAFGLVAMLSAPAAWWVWRTMPDGVKPAPMSAAAWRATLTHPGLMAIVFVTACSGAGQFTLFPYLAPYFSQHYGASAAGISAIFLCFGVFGLLGNLLLTRHIDRLGASRCVAIGLVGVAISMTLWPLIGALWMAFVVMVPWALGCFASNSAQQARLGAAAPALAAALMALNTSAIYLGQAIGAAGGGAMIAAGGFAPLPLVGLAWVLVALALSAWTTRRFARDGEHVGA